VLVISSSFGYSYEHFWWEFLSSGGKKETTGNVILELTTEMNPFTLQFMVTANLTWHNPKLVQQSPTLWFKSSDLFCHLPYLQTELLLS
jgi:hypothetical protein